MLPVELKIAIEVERLRFEEKRGGKGSADEPNELGADDSPPNADSWRLGQA